MLIRAVLAAIQLTESRRGPMKPGASLDGTPFDRVGESAGEADDARIQGEPAPGLATHSNKIEEARS